MLNLAKNYVFCSLFVFYLKNFNGFGITGLEL
jgi:hypothetical protein